MANTTEGRSLPPLLPLEYCSIERAARMLECEPEDMLHWASINAINLYLNLSGLNVDGEILLDKEEFNEIEEVTLKQDEFLNSTQLGFSNLFYSNKVDSNAFDPQSELYILQVSHIIGLWSVNWYYIEKCLLNNLNSFSIRRLHPHTKPNIDLTLPETIEFNINKLQVLRSDLEMLYESITTGKLLNNRFNDADIAKKILEQDKLRINAKRPLENNSKPRTSALISMCKLFIAKQDLNISIKPDGLQTKINQELRKYGIPEIEGERTLLQAYIAAGE